MSASSRPHIIDINDMYHVVMPPEHMSHRVLATVESFNRETEVWDYVGTVEVAAVYAFLCAIEEAKEGLVVD